MALKPLTAFVLSSLFIFCVSLVSAQEGGRAAVEVRNVNFNLINAGQRGNWHETEIQLDVRRANNPEANNPRFASNLQVTLYLCFQVGRGDDAQLIYYTADVEVAAMEVGTRQDRVRFYIPPEIVKRDRIARADPFAFMVELRADGNEIPLSGESTRRVSSNLQSGEAVRNFLDQVGSNARINDGILMPIYYTPFINDRRADDAPPFIRNR